MHFALYLVRYGLRLPRRPEMTVEGVLGSIESLRRRPDDARAGVALVEWTGGEPLFQIGGSALTDKNIQVPEDHLDIPGARDAAFPVTSVPFRNAHFLSVGVSWAEALGAREIYIGAVAEDSPGCPDCRPEEYRVFQDLIRVGTRPETDLRLVTPVICRKKSEIIRRGKQLGGPLYLTWSCDQAETLACGRCDSCQLRLRAFAEAGAADPVPCRERAAGQAGV